jgi:hypothetical protein
LVGGYRVGGYRCAVGGAGKVKLRYSSIAATERVFNGDLLL